MCILCPFSYITVLAPTSALVDKSRQAGTLSKDRFRLSMLVHICNASTWKVKTGKVQGTLVSFLGTILDNRSHQKKNPDVDNTPAQRPQEIYSIDKTERNAWPCSILAANVNAGWLKMFAVLHIAINVSKCHKYWFGGYKSILAGKETNDLRSMNQSWLCICHISQKEESRIRRVTRKGHWPDVNEQKYGWAVHLHRELHSRQN